jgi:hypothetical protein
LNDAADFGVFEEHAGLTAVAVHSVGGGNANGGTQRDGARCAGKLNGSNDSNVAGRPLDRWGDWFPRCGLPGRLLVRWGFRNRNRVLLNTLWVGLVRPRGGLEAAGTTAAGVPPEYRSLLEPDSGRGGREEMRCYAACGCGPIRQNRESKLVV